MTVVFRGVKTKIYTMMSNQHLKDKRLTLKAKGLMSVMLSLPENWDYTLRGLSAISKEGVDAISEAVKELERSGYVIRNRKRDARGRLRAEAQPSVSPSGERWLRIKFLSAPRRICAASSRFAISVTKLSGENYTQKHSFL